MPARRDRGLQVSSTLDVGCQGTVTVDLLPILIVRRAVGGRIVVGGHRFRQRCRLNSRLERLGRGGLGLLDQLLNRVDTLARRIDRLNRQPFIVEQGIQVRCATIQSLRRK